MTLEEPAGCRMPSEGRIPVRTRFILKGKFDMNPTVTVVPAFDFRAMVSIAGNEVITTSLRVAEYFNKQHKNIIRTIKRLETDCSPEFNRLNFEPVEYIDKKGEIRLMYNIRKNGWMMLVMGFTGRPATAIKESYIAAFDWMTEQLSRRKAIGEEMQHQFVIKETRSKLKGTIGSRLMNERKKEKPILAVEHDHIMKITAPAMLAIMEGKD